MKKKMLMLISLLLSIFVVTGCSKYEKDTSYNTDLYGTYVNHIGTEGSNYFSENKYIFNTDNTYNYISKEIQYNETTENTNETGKILLSENISDDITKITFDSDVIEYKYKNMLGGLYELEIPSGKTFDLVIPTPSDNWAGSYPNAANVFDKNGIYHSCLDITKCEDTEENHMGVYYQYVRKNNLIYFIDPSISDMDYQILYYIVDDGLFYPELYKQE